jgi:hypothetical protein
MTFDFDKAVAELPILREFIEFVNQQVGVYMDCLVGFRGNTVRVERQVARINRQTGVRVEKGRPVMVYESMEDPTSPPVIHHRITRSEDFLAANAEGGFNERHVRWSIIVFLFAYWDEQVRPAIAAVRGVDPKDVKVDALGDLRIIRNSIVHNKGVLSAADHAKLKKMRALVKPDAVITLSHDGMHSVFVAVKQAISEIILTYAGDLPGAPDPSQIVGVAIANAGPRNGGDAK